jgi:hypothetical protein
LVTDITRLVPEFCRLLDTLRLSAYAYLYWNRLFSIMLIPD